jgi:DNA polymerase III epsilon subunit-like protein
MSYAPYVSIDIETTGLDESYCQVIEIGMVVETDWRTPIDKLPSCSFLVDPGRIVGEPFALQMNAQILREIEKCRRNGGNYTDTESAVQVMFTFLKHYVDYKQAQLHFVVAGKNYGSFDARFLERLPNWKGWMKPNHRPLDPGCMYFDPRIDVNVPSTAECMARAGLDPDVKHRAEEDARNVVRLIRRKAAMQSMADFKETMRERGIES